MKPAALVALCSALVMSAPAHAQDNDVQPGYFTVNVEEGHPVARLTDPESNNTLVANCAGGALGITILYGGLTMQQVPEQEQEQEQEQEVTVTFASRRSEAVEVPATSKASEGLAITAADEATQAKVRQAFRSFSAMTSDDVGTVTISGDQGGDIGVLTVSGKGSTRALGQVMRACGN